MRDLMMSDMNSPYQRANPRGPMNRPQPTPYATNRAPMGQPQQQLPDWARAGLGGGGQPAPQSASPAPSTLYNFNTGKQEPYDPKQFADNPAWQATAADPNGWHPSTETPGPQEPLRGISSSQNDIQGGMAPASGTDRSRDLLMQGLRGAPQPSQPGYMGGARMQPNPFQRPQPMQGGYGSPMQSMQQQPRQQGYGMPQSRDLLSSGYGGYGQQPWNRRQSGMHNNAGGMY